MKLTEHQLKDIHQKSTNRQRNSDCPSADELYQLLSNSLNSQKRAKFAAHLEGCADCSEEFRMAREVSENVAKSTPRVRFWQKSEWRPLAIAAAIVLALSAGILIYNRTTLVPGSPVERGEQRFVLKTQPADGAILEAPPAKLQWSPIPDVQKYYVKLLNYESALIVDSGPITSTEYSLPQEIRNKLQSGQLYYWRIEYEKGGEQKSKLRRFTIR